MDFIMNINAKIMNINDVGPGRVYCVVLLGQLVSIAFAAMIVASSVSAKLGVDAPITLSFFSYLSITWVYGCILVHRRQKLLIPWYWYALLAFIHVQGNYFVNKAYQLSLSLPLPLPSIISVTILDCWMIVWVIILTWWFLDTKYSAWELFCVIGCVTGLLMVTLTDAEDKGSWNPVLGDILVIAGTCFFALSNVGEEFCVKMGVRIEAITMLGLFGMLVTLVEMAIFEMKNLESVSWSPQVILTFIGYAIAGFTFYTLTPILLQASGATFFILSLFTTHIWALVIRSLIYEPKVDFSYYMSFWFVGLYIVVFFKRRVFTLIDNLRNTDQPYQLLPEEVV